MEIHEKSSPTPVSSMPSTSVVPRSSASCYNWTQPGYPHCFKPTTAAFHPSVPAFNPSVPGHYTIALLDCRHGRVLLRDRLGENLFVSDLTSDVWQDLQVHDDIDCETDCFAVLCTVPCCDHHDCRGGPFLVVYMGADEATGGTIFKALVYSSVARAWSAPVSSQFAGECQFDNNYGRATVVGEKIYCLVMPGANIVEYDLIKRCISFFYSSSICSEAHKSPPIVGEDPVLTQNEDGSLGLASTRDSRLYLCSLRMVTHDGKLVAEWVQERVIELDQILPIDMNKHRHHVYMSGFAEGIGILFICTNIGTFTFELKSGRVRKITTSKGLHCLPLHQLLHSVNKQQRHLDLLHLQQNLL